MEEQDDLHRKKPQWANPPRQGVSALEFDSWLNNHRCFTIVQSKRRHATSETAPDELVVVVTLYRAPRRR